MNVAKELEELEAVAQQHGIAIHYEPMTGLVQGSGGLCKVRGQWRIIMDRRLKPPERLQILAESLRRFHIEDESVSPAVRRLLAS